MARRAVERLLDRLDRYTPELPLSFCCRNLYLDLDLYYANGLYVWVCHRCGVHVVSFCEACANVPASLLLILKWLKLPAKTMYMLVISSC